MCDPTQLLLQPPSSPQCAALLSVFSSVQSPVLPSVQSSAHSPAAQLSAVQSPAWARVPVPAQSPALSTLAQPAGQLPTVLSVVQLHPQCAVQSLKQLMVQSLV